MSTTTRNIYLIDYWFNDQCIDELQTKFTIIDKFFVQIYHEELLLLKLKGFNLDFEEFDYSNFNPNTLHYHKITKKDIILCVILSGNIEAKTLLNNLAKELMLLRN